MNISRTLAPEWELSSGFCYAFMVVGEVEVKWRLQIVNDWLLENAGKLSENAKKAGGI